MKAYIEASHKRCREFGISPEATFSSKLLEGTELQENLKENSKLILAASPFMEHLYNFVKGSGFLLFFVIKRDAF